MYLYDERSPVQAFLPTQLSFMWSSHINILSPELHNPFLIFLYKLKNIKESFLFDSLRDLFINTLPCYKQFYIFFEHHFCIISEVGSDRLICFPELKAAVCNIVRVASDKMGQIILNELLGKSFKFFSHVSAYTESDNLVQWPFFNKLVEAVWMLDDFLTPTIWPATSTIALFHKGFGLIGDWSYVTEAFTKNTYAFMISPISVSKSSAVLLAISATYVEPGSCTETFTTQEIFPLVTVIFLFIPSSVIPKPSSLLTLSRIARLLMMIFYVLINCRFVCTALGL